MKSIKENNKKIPNAVDTYDSEGKELGVFFETATPFETQLKCRNLLIGLIKTFWTDFIIL